MKIRVYVVSVDYIRQKIRIEIFKNENSGISPYQDEFRESEREKFKTVL